MIASLKIPVQNLPDRGEPSRFNGIYLKNVDYGWGPVAERVDAVEREGHTEIKFAKECRSPNQWSTEETRTLERMRAEGKTTEEIAQALDRRTVYAVRNKLYRMGLKG